MSDALLYEFSGVSADDHLAVNEKLGLDPAGGGGDWPLLISHTGAAGTGSFFVFEVGIQAIARGLHGGSTRTSSRSVRNPGANADRMAVGHRVPRLSADARRRVDIMSNMQKGLIGAAVGLSNLAMLLLIWRWWLRRTELSSSSVDRRKFTSRGEAAEQAAFKGDGAYSYGEFAGGSDSWAYGRHADEV